MIQLAIYDAPEDDYRATNGCCGLKRHQITTKTNPSDSLQSESKTKQSHPHCSATRCNYRWHSFIGISERNGTFSSGDYIVVYYSRWAVSCIPYLLL